MYEKKFIGFNFHQKTLLSRLSPKPGYSGMEGKCYVSVILAFSVLASWVTMMHIVCDLKKFEDTLKLSPNPDQFHQIFAFLKVSEYFVMTSYLTAIGVLLLIIYNDCATPGEGQDEIDNNFFERTQRTMRALFLVALHP